MLGLRPTKRSYHSHNYYVIEHDPQAGASLAEVARTLGVEVVEPAGELQNHWLVRAQKPDLTSRSNDPDPVSQAFNDLRRRDSYSHPPRSQDLPSRVVVSSVKYLALQTLRQRVKRAPPPIPPPNNASTQGVADHFGIVDPLFPEQWHLVNDDHPQHMHNVTPVWEMGITGKGVISSLVDDGLDYTSEDLIENFVRTQVLPFNCKPHSVFLKRTKTIRTTSMTMKLYQLRRNGMTIMAPGVPDRLLLEKTTLVVLELHTNRGSQVFVSYLVQYQMSTRQPLSTTVSKTSLSTVAVGDLPIMDKRWKVQDISSERPSSMASITEEVEKVLYSSSRAAMEQQTVINVTSTAIPTASTRSRCPRWTTKVYILTILNPARPIWLLRTVPGVANILSDVFFLSTFFV